MLGSIWGCILSELKEYTPRPPKKNSGRDFDFPPRPSLKRPKEGGQGRVVAGRLLRVPRQRRARGSSLVKCRVLPDDLFVRHGVQCAEVRGRPRPCSRRGCRVWGQDSLGPFPPAGCGRREAFFLLTAPPPFSFCRLQKENGGGKLPGFPGTPGRSTGQHGRVWSPRPTEATLAVRSKRVDVPRAWPPPTKFRPEIWSAVKSSCSMGAALAMVSDGPMYLGP